MKKHTLIILVLCIIFVAFFDGCTESTEKYKDAVSIELSNDGISVDAKEKEHGVRIASDIVYYPEGMNFAFGEGSEGDAHSKEEADKHKVVHITKPGTYILSGKLDYGQIAVDLGNDAKDNPKSKVTLVLNGADINCEVAPAVIFYNVYECGTKDEETATKDVDTTNAGANVIIADGTVNNIMGSYVAKIYASAQLNEEGTEVVDSKKLHKYDGAFYSKMSMNISAEKKGDGILNIKAENEGMDSELHLTINSGNINIESGNDGINTNEDNISVTTINGGNVSIKVNGSTGEGDGIDSNGWLIINGGTLNASGCGFSGDAGIDSDRGIHINGGEIVAAGNMLDRISESDATYVVFEFAQKQEGAKTYFLKDKDGKMIKEWKPENDFSTLVVSSNDVTEGEYTLWRENEVMFVAEGIERDGMHPRGGEHMKNGENSAPPRDMNREQTKNRMLSEEMPNPPTGEMPSRMERGFGKSFDTTKLKSEFAIKKGGNYFIIINKTEE